MTIVCCVVVDNDSCVLCCGCRLIMTTHNHNHYNPVDVFEVRIMVVVVIINLLCISVNI